MLLDFSILFNAYICVVYLGFLSHIDCYILSTTIIDNYFCLYSLLLDSLFFPSYCYRMAINGMGSSENELCKGPLLNIWRQNLAYFKLT